MFKIITIGVLLFVLYRMVTKQPLLGGTFFDKIDEESKDDDDFVDYEEVDD